MNGNSLPANELQQPEKTTEPPLKNERIERRIGFISNFVFAKSKCECFITAVIAIPEDTEGLSSMAEESECDITEEEEGEEKRNDEMKKPLKEDNEKEEEDEEEEDEIKSEMLNKLDGVVSMRNDALMVKRVN